MAFDHLGCRDVAFLEDMFSDPSLFICEKDKFTLHFVIGGVIVLMQDVGNIYFQVDLLVAICSLHKFISAVYLPVFKRLFYVFIFFPTE